MSGRLPPRNPKHAKAQDLLQAFQTHCHPPRRRTHLQIRKGHLRPPADRRCLAGESPCCPGNTRTSSGGLLWVRPAQASIRPDVEPAPLEPCPSHHLEPLSCPWDRKGLWRPRVDIGSNSPSQPLLLSRAQQSPGLLGLGLGPRRGWGLHPPPRRALPPGLSLPLSKAFFVPMPTNLGRASPWKAFAPNPSGCASLLPCG